MKFLAIEPTGKVFIYQPMDSLIAVHLTEDDIENIKNMADDATIYSAWNHDTFEDREVEKLLKFWKLLVDRMESNDIEDILNWIKFTLIDISPRFSHMKEK